MCTISFKQGMCGIAVAGLLIPTAQAVSLDLTGATTSGTINSAFFIRTDAASTGTGVIDSFVRLSQSGNGTTAEGYNADARPVMPDVNTSPTFTRDLLLSEVPVVVNPSGQIGSFYEFLLDINQNSSDPFLSLDAIDIYTRATALATANTLASLTGTSTLRYSLDGAPAGDSELLLNYNINSGSGSGDLFAYIPTSAFGANTEYVYLYSKFGFKGGIYVENDGFEEWAVRKAGTPPPPSVPEGGATLVMLSCALGALGLLRRRLTA